MVDVGGGYQRRAKVSSEQVLPRGRLLYILSLHSGPVFPFVARLYISPASFQRLNVGVTSDRKFGRRNLMGRATSRLCIFRSLYPWPDPSLQDREVKQSIRQMRAGMTGQARISGEQLCLWKILGGLHRFKGRVHRIARHDVRAKKKDKNNGEDCSKTIEIPMLQE